MRSIIGKEQVGSEKLEKAEALEESLFALEGGVALLLSSAIWHT
ncbi:MAG: hypothetical protein QW179_02390 [Candidatus Hadarchaeales archaeon]